jgi:hypothetical protein
MFFDKLAKAAIVGCALASLPGCATTRSDLTSAADELEHSTNTLARDTRDEPSERDYRTPDVRDVRALADDAHEFRRTVDDPAAVDRDVRVAFDRVSRSYHLVRDEVDRSDSRDVRSDFKAVTDAYLDIEHGMDTYPERPARADHDYPAGP